LRLFPAAAGRASRVAGPPASPRPAVGPPRRAQSSRAAWARPGDRSDPRARTHL